VAHLDYMRFGVATAQRGWAERADIINTYPFSKLRRFLTKRVPVKAHSS
jgi:DNA polymerase (family 10)